MGSLEAFTSTNASVAQPQTHNSAAKMFFFVQRQHKVRPACNKRVATHTHLNSQEGV